MRFLKITLISLGALAFACLALLAFVLLTFQDDDYRRLAARAATHLTGFAVTFNGPFSLNLSTEPSLSAQAIRLDPGPAGDPPPMTAIGSLKVRIALWPLITGTLMFRELQIEDVVLAIESGRKTAGDDPRRAHRIAMRDIRIPVFESVRLQNIRLDLIDTAANRTFQAQLRRFSIDGAPNSSLSVSGLGSINGNEFSLEGRVGALAAILEGKEPYPVAFDFQAAGFHVSLSGTVEDMVAGKGMALRLTGETGELAVLLGMLEIRTPPLGALNFQATVSRDVNAPRLSDLSVTLSGGARLELALTGAVDDLISGGGTDFRFTAACSDPEVLTLLLPPNLPEVQRIRVQGALREAAGVLAAENLAIEIDAAGGLSAAAGGRIGLGGSLRALSPTELDTDIELSMPTSHILRAYGVDWPADVGPLRARARLTGPLEGLALEELFIESVGDGPLRMTSRGRIGGLPTRADRRLSQIDLWTTLEADTTQALAAGFGLRLPELGAAALNTRIQGASDRLQLTEIDGRISSAQGLQIEVAGRVDFHSVPSGGLLHNLDIRTRIDAPSAAVALAPFSRAVLPELKPFRAGARIGGSFEAPSLDDLVISTGQSGPLRIQINGAVGRLPLDGREPAGVKIETVIAADSTAALSSVTGDSVPEFGPLNITALIDDRSGPCGVSKLLLVLGEEKSAPLTVTGRIASLLRLNRFFFEGIDLTAVARNFPLQPLAGSLGRSLSDLGPLNGRFHVAGNAQRLYISKADLTTLSPGGVKIAATGGIARIRLTGENPLEEMNVSLTATAPGWEALPLPSGLDLPDLGPVQAKATINHSGGGFDVENFQIRCGNAQHELLHLEGQISRIGVPGQMILNAVFETASRPWVAHYLQKNEGINVPLTGVLQASEDAEGFRIQEFRLATADDTPLAISAQGRIRRQSKPAAVDIQLEVRAPDPGLFGSLAGISLPPFGPLAINGRISGNTQELQFSGETRFGDSLFQSAISASFASQRPAIAATFASDLVQLKDIGITPGPPLEEIPKPAESTQPATGAVFHDTPLSFKILRGFDLVFYLNAETVVGQNIRIENLDLDIRLENGRLRIFPCSMVYAVGFTEIDLTLDASGPNPFFELRITGQGIDVEDLLARAHEPLILSGKLGLEADLRSTGRSRREMASNLMGELSLSIENGRIRRIVNFLSLDALNLVLATADQRRHTDLNCMVGKLRFQQGVGDIEVFFMDTPSIRARAGGNVDLASERIDIVINPEQKGRLFRRRTSAVRIVGPLARPSVRTIPLEEAARLSAKILMPYVFLPERVLGSLWYRISRDPNESPCARELKSR